MDDPQTSATSVYDRALTLQEMLVTYATGGSGDEPLYLRIRQEFVRNADTKALLPDFLRASHTLPSFWSWIKIKYSSYAERRVIIRSGFAPLLDYLQNEGGASPIDQSATETLSKFAPEDIVIAWDKALKRRTNDPEGAITAARSLLESVCKHVLDEAGVAYGPNDDLPKLYGTVARELNLAPSQHTEDAFKTILGGCHSVVNGLSNLRNRVGDAHGHSPRMLKPAPRHAALAVNLAGAMATYIIETSEHLNKAKLGF